MYSVDDIKAVAKERAVANAQIAQDISKAELEAFALELFEADANVYIETYNQAYIEEVNSIIAKVKRLAVSFAKSLAESSTLLDLREVPPTLDKQYQAYLELYVKEVEVACEKLDVLGISPEEIEDNPVPLGRDKDKTSFDDESDFSPFAEGEVVVESENESDQMQNEESDAKFKRIKNMARSDAGDSVRRGQKLNEKRLEIKAKKKFKDEVDSAFYIKHFIEFFTMKRVNQPIEERIKASARSRALQNVSHGSKLNRKTIEETAYKEYPEPAQAKLFIEEYVRIFEEKLSQISSSDRIKALARNRAINYVSNGLTLNRKNLDERAKKEFPDPAQAALYIEEHTKTFEEQLKKKSPEDQIKARARKDARDAFSGGIKLDEKRLSKSSEQFKEHARLYFDTYVEIYNEKKKALPESSSGDEKSKDKTNPSLRDKAFRKAKMHSNRITPLDYDKFCLQVKKEFGPEAENFMVLYNEYKDKLTPKTDKAKVAFLAKKQGKNAAHNGTVLNQEALNKNANVHGEHKQLYIDEYTKAYNHQLKLKAKPYLEEDSDEEHGRLNEQQAIIKYLAITRASHDARIGIKLNIPLLREKAFKEFGKEHVDFFVNIFKSTYETKEKPKSLKNQVKTLAQARAWRLAERGEAYDIDVLNKEAQAQGDLADVYKERFIETYNNKMKKFEKEGVNTKTIVDPKTKEQAKDPSMVKKIAENLASRAAQQANGVNMKALEKAAEPFGKEKQLYIETYIATYKANAAKGIENLKKHAFNRGLECGKKWEKYNDLETNNEAEKHFDLASTYKAAFKRGFDISFAAKAKSAASSKETHQVLARTPSNLPAAALPVNGFELLEGSPTLLFQGPSSVSLPAKDTPLSPSVANEGINNLQMRR